LLRDDIGLSVASQYRFLELAATEANDQLLGRHVAAEMDLRSIGILFYLTGSARTVAEALENLARYSAVMALSEFPRSSFDPFTELRRMQSEMNRKTASWSLQSWRV
jgi:hypothetical protein